MPALGPTQPLTQWVSGVLSMGVERPGRDAGYSPPFSAEIKNCGTMPPLLEASSWHGS
jgi:hypothetical protein